MLDDGQIKAREEDVVISTEGGHGDDEEAVVLAGIAADNTRTRISALTIRADVFSLCGLIEISHQPSVELEVTHARFRL